MKAFVTAILLLLFSGLALGQSYVPGPVAPNGPGYPATQNEYHKGGWHMYATTDEVPEYLLEDGMAVYASDAEQLFLRWAGDWREIMPANHNHSITNLAWRAPAISGPYPNTNAFLMGAVTNGLGDSKVVAVDARGTLAYAALYMQSPVAGTAPSVLWSVGYPAAEYGTRWTNNPTLANMSVTNLFTVKAIALNGLSPITNWPNASTNVVVTNSTPAYQYWLLENGTNVLVTTDGTYTHKEYYSTEPLLEDPGAPLMSLISADFVRRAGDTMTGPLHIGPTNDDTAAMSAELLPNGVAWVSGVYAPGDSRIEIRRGDAASPDADKLYKVRSVLGTLDSNVIWDAHTDGANSGLDADLLDGNQGVYYASAASVSNQLTNYVAKLGSRMYGPLTNGYIRYTSNGIEGWSANSSDISIAPADNPVGNAQAGSVRLMAGDGLAGDGGDIVLAPGSGTADDGKVLAQGDLSVAGTMAVAGATTLSNTLDLTDHAIINVSTLSASGDISLQPSSKVQVDGNLEVLGDANAYSVTIGDTTWAALPETNGMMRYGSQDGHLSFGEDGWGLYDDVDSPNWTGGTVYEYYDDSRRMNYWPLWSHGWDQGDMGQTEPMLMMRLSDGVEEEFIARRELVSSNAIAGLSADSTPGAGANVVWGYGRSIQFDDPIMYSQPAAPWRMYNIVLDGDVDPRCNRNLDMQGHSILNATMGGTLTASRLALLANDSTNMLYWGNNNWLGFQPPTGSTLPKMRGYYSVNDGYNRGVVLQLVGGDLMVHGAIVATNGIVAGNTLDMRTNDISGVRTLGTSNYPVQTAWTTTNGLRLGAARFEVRGTNLYFTASNGVTGKVMLEFE